MAQDVRLSLTELIAAVRAEGRPADLGGAVRRAGMESVVLETAGWIYRFPRHFVDFDRELAVLAAVDGRLPVATPRVEWTGQRSRFCAYRKIVGWHFDPAAYRSASRSRQVALAASMAEFLVAMHDALTDAEVTRLGVPEFFSLSARADLIELDEIPAEVRPQVSELIARSHRASERVGASEKRLLHNDFTSDNIVFDGEVGRLSGVWDFSGVSVGPPCFDFRYLLRDPEPLTSDVVREYEHLTGRDVDREALVTAARIGEVWSLLRRGTSDNLMRTVLNWECHR